MFPLTTVKRRTKISSSSWTSSTNQRKKRFCHGFYDQSVVFVLNDADKTRWWASAVDDDQIVLHIVRQDELKVGQTMVIRTADYPDQVVRSLI
jgi:hypothetical protein